MLHEIILNVARWSCRDSGKRGVSPTSNGRNHTKTPSYEVESASATSQSFRLSWAARGAMFGCLIILGLLVFFGASNQAKAAQLWTQGGEVSIGSTYVYGPDQFICGFRVNQTNRPWQNLHPIVCNLTQEAKNLGIHIYSDNPGWSGGSYYEWERDGGDNGGTLNCSEQAPAWASDPHNIIVGVHKWGDSSQVDNAWCGDVSLGPGNSWNFAIDGAGIAGVPANGTTLCPQNSLAIGFIHQADKNDAWSGLRCAYINVPAFTTVGGAPTGSDNIPASFNPGETKSINNQSIQMVNNREAPWISDWVGWSGIPSVGLCDSNFAAMRGGAPGNPDPPTSSDGSSCATRYIWSSNQVSLQHSGSFTVNPAVGGYWKWGTITTGGSEKYVDNSYEDCTGNGYDEYDEPICITEGGFEWEWVWWRTTSYDSGSSQHVVPGESVWFPVWSMKAPTTPNVYTEWWNFVWNGPAYTQQFTNFSKNITVVAPAVGTIDIFSKNRVTGSALSSSWGSTPGGYNADNSSEKHFTAVPNGSYTISPSSNSAGTLYAFGGVGSGDVVATEDKESKSWMGSLPSYFTSLARAAVTSSEVNCNPPSNLTCPSVPNQSVTTADPNITFNIVWDPRAVLGRSPSTLNLSRQRGVATTVSGTVTVNNNGGAPGSQLNWTATDNQSWLSLSSTSGQNAQGSSTNFQATADITNLAPGNYTGTITLNGQSQLYPIGGRVPPTQVTDPASLPVTVNLTVIEARDYTI